MAETYAVSAITGNKNNRSEPLLFLSINRRRRYSLFVFFVRKGKAENEFSAHAFRTDNIDIFIMGLDDFFSDGQTEAGALLIFTPGKIRFIETIPNELQAVLGDADPTVFYGNKDFIPFFCGFYFDDGVGMGKFDGVVH